MQNHTDTLRNIGLWPNDTSKQREALAPVLLAMTRCDTLRRALPNWTFQPYGKSGAVVCYPPNGQWNTSASVQDALREHAAISGIVSGNGIVTCKLAIEPGHAMPHPLTVF